MFSNKPLIRATAGSAAVAGVLLVVAGCGGSSSPSVAHLASNKDPAASNSSESSGGGSSSPGSSASDQQKMVAFAQCMRSHGVPSFPEPQEGHFQFKGAPGPGDKGGPGGPGGAQFEAARRDCQKLLPNGGEPTPQQRAAMQERALKFSACMRSHGVPNFPNPTFEGNGARLTLHAGGPGSIDPKSPQFQSAQKACRSYFGPPGSKGGPAPPGGGAQGEARVAAP
jgi:hypothetical protein